MSVEPLDADSAVHAERPQIRFEDEGPAVGIFAGNDFEAFAWSNDGVAQRLDRDGVLQSVRASSGCGVVTGFSAGLGVAVRKVATSARLVRNVTSRMDGMA